MWSQNRDFQKLRYVDKTGWKGGWALSLAWDDLYWTLMFNFELSLELRLLIDINLALDFNFPLKVQQPVGPPKMHVSRYGYAVYDKDIYWYIGIFNEAKFDEDVYEAQWFFQPIFLPDPESLRPIIASTPYLEAEEGIWRLSYKYTDHHDYRFNQPLRYAEKFRDAYEPILGKVISKKAYDIVLRRAEGIYVAGCFFDFNCFDIGRFEPACGFDCARFDEDVVGSRFDEAGACQFRLSGSEKIISPSETSVSMERFDLSLFDYARFDGYWVPDSDKHQQILDDYKLRIEPLWMGTLWAIRDTEFKTKGVAAMSRNTWDYRRLIHVLDKYDVPVQDRWRYYAFLKEIGWKGRLTPITSREDIIQKYVRYGCDEACLRELARKVARVERPIVGRERY